MKKSLLSRVGTLVATLLLTALASQAAQFMQPKREFRSAWVATVWCLDWPGTQAGGENAAAKQKQQMIALLDSLHNNNFNAINFQVRSMCDAMYESSYEPWSSYLTGTRGQAPTYDPLAFVVKECHKRGMECHAWVNPYRFSSGTDWNTAADLDLKNNGWLIRYGDYIVLDPGQQRTIDRIVNVCREIITKYDVDGVLYDDYFYPNNIPESSAAEDYQEWLDSGTTLSIGNWRRDNVNRMVAAVYNMIQETRPEVRFGISPAGVAASSSAVASQYGVTPCPGSDWQYNTIYSDPLAWMSAHTIDYMSPQVYWHIGNSAADYGKIVPWWNMVAQKMGRHMYVSHSISELRATSIGSENPTPGMTYNTAYLYDEYANQVELMRTTNEDGAYGSIYYSCKYLYNLNAPESFAHYLKRVVYRTPALPPAMTWKPESEVAAVTDLAFDGTTLTWSERDNVRYTIYAFPRSMTQEQFNFEGEYLLGMSYYPNFVIPEDKRDDFQYAVCIFDRVGYEYNPAFYGSSYEPLAAPTLISPANEEQVYHPFNFTWEPVEGATSYVVEISRDASMEQVLQRITVDSEMMSSTLIADLENGQTHYWRVLSEADGRAQGRSEVRAFVPTLLLMGYPTEGEVQVPRPFTATWNAPSEECVATLTIASDPDMENVVYTATATGSSAEVPSTALNAGTRYYITVALNYEGTDMITPVTEFVTEFDVPTFIVPIDGGILYADDHVTVEPQSEAVSYTIELSNSPTTWGRYRYTETIKDGNTSSAKAASEIKVNSKLLVDGDTYYARARLSYLNADGQSRNTDFCPVITFVYSASNRPTAAVGDVNGDGTIDGNDLNTLVNILLGKDNAENYAGRANVDGEGGVDGNDLNKLINIILGK